MRHRFSCGFLNYEAGEWTAARTMLEETRTMLGHGAAECGMDE